MEDLDLDIDEREVFMLYLNPRDRRAITKDGKLVPFQRAGRSEDEIRAEEHRIQIVLERIQSEHYAYYKKHGRYYHVDFKPDGMNPTEQERLKAVREVRNGADPSEFPFEVDLDDDFDDDDEDF